MTATRKQGISRRTMLRLSAGAALSVGLGGTLGTAPRLARAQAPAARPSAFYSFPVGSYTLTAIQDGTLEQTAANFAINAAQGEPEALLTENNLPTTVNATINVLLVNTGSKLILLDTGIGTGFVPGAGRLVPTLEAIGVKAADITDVVISHFHVDHIVGAGDGTNITFPNATYHISEVEQGFLKGFQPTGNADFDNLVGLAVNILNPIEAKGQLKTYKFDSEIVSGVNSVAAAGHSPGHSALLVADGNDSVLNLVDTANHYLLALKRPDWHFVFDAMPDMAVETRKRLLQRAVDEKQKIYGYHFPFPGLGYVDTDGDGYRFLVSG